MKRTSRPVTDRLSAGAPHALAEANTVAEEAQHSAQVLHELVEALADERSVVTIRAANALNKVQQIRPDLLTPYSHSILRAASVCLDLRTRWNLIVLLGNLPLRGRDKALAIELFFEALGSRSGLLRTFALTGLVNFAREDEALRRRVLPIVRKAVDDSSAAVRARARKLITEFVPAAS